MPHNKGGYKIKWCWRKQNKKRGLNKLSTKTQFMKCKIYIGCSYVNSKTYDNNECNLCSVGCFLTAHSVFINTNLCEGNGICMVFVSMHRLFIWPLVSLSRGGGELAKSSSVCLWMCWRTKHYGLWGLTMGKNMCHCWIEFELRKTECGSI